MNQISSKSIEQERKETHPKFPIVKLHHRLSLGFPIGLGVPGIFFFSFLLCGSFIVFLLDYKLNPRSIYMYIYIIPYTIDAYMFWGGMVRGSTTHTTYYLCTSHTCTYILDEPSIHPSIHLICMEPRAPRRPTGIKKKKKRSPQSSRSLTYAINWRLIITIQPASD